MNDEQEILPDSSVDLGDGVFWAMDLDKYEVRGSDDRVHFSMDGDAARVIQKQEKIAVPKQAFIFGFFRRSLERTWP